MPSPVAYTVVDSIPSLHQMLTKIQSLPTSPPSLYIDLEGVNLSRFGTISILQIYVAPLDHTYLVDIYILGKSAFDRAIVQDRQITNGGTPAWGNAGSQATATFTMSLKAIFESNVIPKVIFDLRNDSNALFYHYGIRLAGIYDIQLMDLATRLEGHRRRYVSGLANCIKYDADLSPLEMMEFQNTKELGKRLFAPELGGTYEVFNQRPLAKEVVDYCVADVRYLPRLWAKYNAGFAAWTPAFESTWRERCATETQRRIQESQTEAYQPHGRQKSLAPYGWGAEVVTPHVGRPTWGRPGM